MKLQTRGFMFKMRRQHSLFTTKNTNKAVNAAKDEWNCDENLTKRKATAHAFFWVFLSNKINMEKYSFRYRWKKINYSSGNITRENVLTSAPGLPVAPTGPASPSGPWKQKNKKLMRAKTWHETKRADWGGGGTQAMEKLKLNRLLKGHGA